jgi:hypothetical protein
MWASVYSVFMEPSCPSMMMILAMCVNHLWHEILMSRTFW